MKSRKKPMRLCIGCSEMKPKRELIRVVKSADGTIQLDFTGKIAGRGTYVCPNLDCLDAARKGHRIERAFGTRIPEALYEEMEHALQEQLAGNTDDLS